MGLAVRDAIKVGRERSWAFCAALDEACNASPSRAEGVAMPLYAIE